MQRKLTFTLYAVAEFQAKRVKVAGLLDPEGPATEARAKRS